MSIYSNKILMDETSLSSWKDSFSVCLDPHLRFEPRFVFCVFVLFFFFFSRILEKRIYCSCTVHWTVTVNVDFSAVNSASVYCSWTHKFHFSATFSLKMGPTVLFTHLKIILLLCFQFSIFSFNKISSIQTDPSSKKNKWWIVSNVYNTTQKKCTNFSHQ